MASSGRTGLALAAVAAGVALAALDQTMVVTVLPSILRDLHIPYTRLNDAAWIVTGYLLGYTVAMPLFGRIADVRGRRLMYVAAVIIFMAGSVLCVLAGSLQTLVGARIIQAAGGGALVPVAMAISAAVMPAHRRAFALGVIGAAAEAGGVIGPLYGAVLSQAWGWRAIFIINIPLGMLLIIACILLVPADDRRRVEATQATGDGDSGAVPADPADRPQRPAPRPHGRIDYVGALLLGAMLATLTIGLSGNSQQGGATMRPPFLVASVLTLAAFILWERRQADPLVELDLFRSRPFSAANLANLAVGAALIVGMVEVPLYAYSLLGESEVGGGLLLMRMTVMIPVGAVVGGFLGDLVGYRLTGIMGFIATAAGYALMSLWPAEVSSLTMTRDLMLTGLGFGIVVAPISATVISSVGSSWTATGSALVTVMRMIGQMVGLSALSSWGLRRFYDLMAGTSLPLQTAGMSDAEFQKLTATYEATMDAALRTVYSDFFLIAAIIAAVAVIPAAFFYRGRGRRGVTLLPQ